MLEGEKSGKQQRTVRVTAEALDFLLRHARGAGIEVYLALADYAGKTGEAWPSWQQLRSRFGMSNDFIARGVEVLVGLGALQKRRRYSKSTVYTLRGLEGTQPITPISGGLDGQSSADRSNGRSESSGKRSEILRRSEHQSSDSTETNQFQEPVPGTRGEEPPPAALGVPGLERELVDLSVERGVFAPDERDGVVPPNGQRARKIRSLVKGHGHDGARQILEETAGGDIIDVGKAGKGKPKARDKPSGPAPPRCANYPRCQAGREVDRERTTPARTVWRPCALCSGAAVE